MLDQMRLYYIVLNTIITEQHSRIPYGIIDDCIIVFNIDLCYMILYYGMLYYIMLYLNIWYVMRLFTILVYYPIACIVSYMTLFHRVLYKIVL